ncbi:hypothetical protein [Enterobacter roggenkampii]|uniref:hypothetical protein n=1 Tax=Enterobacter roggenkampii TaxID=1812935 RepID=UPI002DBBB1B8|nr:hypothetical protein [Enterobacter roggenkampii]MEB5890001.1 hypothetical protein [Enterobacter roggenkampii]
MGSLVIVEGDGLTINPAFGDRTVTITGPAKMSAGGKTTAGGKKVCIVGDELKVKLAATYVTPVYTVPGTGTVTIALDASQKAQVARDNGIPLILKGQLFTATFTFTAPAQMPAPASTPDPAPPSTSKGSFEPSQTFVVAD